MTNNYLARLKPIINTIIVLFNIFINLFIIMGIVFIVLHPLGYKHNEEMGLMGVILYLLVLIIIAPLYLYSVGSIIKSIKSKTK